MTHRQGDFHGLGNALSFFLDFMSTKGTEMREIRFNLAGVRSGQGSARNIEGYAAVFNSPTKIGDNFLEQIRPGAFTRAIREKQDVRALVNHDPNLVLGRIGNGTLELKEDARGLWFRCDVAPTTAGDDVLASIRRNDIGECSFAFAAVSDEWTSMDVGGKRCDLRTLTDVDLFDVSPVCFPAYSGTSVAAERSRINLMFPGGVPRGAPLELRGRIAAALEDHSNTARFANLAALLNDIRRDRN
jgi:HK97 family phage prohead protease